MAEIHNIAQLKPRNSQSEVSDALLELARGLARRHKARMTDAVRRHGLARNDPPRKMPA